MLPRMCGRVCVSAVLDAEEVKVEMTSLRARAAALEEEKQALEGAELPDLRGMTAMVM